ncbi:MAG: hypothetical protein AB7N54_19935 [Alphaproteobacteria bacterium]
MSLNDWLLRQLGGVRAPANTTALREAAGRTIDEDEGWRKLSGDAKRDLSPMTQARMRKLALHLWESNLLARWLVEVTVAFLLAEGVRLTVEDDDAQDWLDAFWRDPINAMDRKLIRKVREYKLYGEQCWPTFVNEVSGHVRLGYLDPELIETVVVDPDNTEQPIGIVTVRDTKGRNRRYRVIVNGPESIFTARTQAIRASFADGECFYYAKNLVSGGRRGRSDLLAQIDYMDGYDQTLFGELERAGFLRAFMWDVTLKGATREDVEARARQIVPPNPGSLRVHNDSEAWEALAPTLNAEDTATAMRLFRNHILGGAGVPEHWFGGGGDVNRATAAEMAEPTLKLFSMEQQEWRAILEDVAYYVIRRRLDPSGKSDFDPAELDDKLQPMAEFPELSARDISKYASALQQAVAAAALAVERGLISEALAVRLVQTVAERLGVSFDAEEELAAAREEAAKRREEDSFPGLPEDDEPEDDPADAAER